MVEYNSYPENMTEIVTSEEWDDFFTFCFESEESRQAYKNSTNELHEDLRITWIKKEKNLGYCIGRKNKQVKFYKIGNIEDWNIFKGIFASQFAKDNS